MNRDILEKVEILTERHFPWESQGLPLDLRGEDTATKIRYVTMWLDEKTRPFRPTALSLVAKIQPILQELEKDLPSDEKPRFFSRIDHTALLKTPESILEKMVRDWDPRKGPPEITFENFTLKLSDIGRFRIVASFVSDVLLIKHAIEMPFGGNSAVLNRAQEALKDEYLLMGDSIKDLIHVNPEERKKGERCCKGVFYPRLEALSHYKVEVQIQTQLQEAWDKKDHFLIYEPARRGEEVTTQERIEIYAMSELLYIADLTFDRLKKAVVERRKAKAEVQNANQK